MKNHNSEKMNVLSQWWRVYMKEDKDRRSSSPTEEKSLLLQLWDMIAVTASLGFTLAVCLICGVLAGRYIDASFATSPWGLVSMALLGALTGFWSLYKKMLRLMKDDAKHHIKK